METLKVALEAVKNGGMKYLTAERKCGVPHSTLFDHIKGCYKKLGAGAPTILTHEEEREIVISLQVLQESGFGLTKELVGVIVRNYLKDQPFRPNPFRSGVPGKDWWSRFLKWWARELTVRKPQHLLTHRATTSEDMICQWFQRVENMFVKTGLNHLSPNDLQHRIWNCDESGFCTSTTSKKILAKRGEREVHETVGGSGQEYINVLAAGCADGIRLPPFVVYKGKHLWSRWM